jgi:trehalose synthase
VVLHDPQTAGLVPLLGGKGATVVWRSHVGIDRTDPLSQVAWDFLLPHILCADRIVASPRVTLPTALAGMPIDRIAPSIDPCSTKNVGVAHATARAILARAGLVQAPEGVAEPLFRRRDGTLARIRRDAAVLRVEPGFRLGRGPLIVHLGRWDRLKDAVGVLDAVVHQVPAALGAHLVLAGPAVDAVTDDPEEGVILDELERAWTSLPLAERRRVTVATLPMDDLEENGAIVNALQRQADLVVKKSLQEGFGLGVTEALWKRRPVVATRVGGIPEQVQHGVSCVLVDDPTDVAAFGSAVSALLEQPERASALGQRGHLIVRRRFLAPRQIVEWAEVIGASQRLSR